MQKSKLVLSLMRIGELYPRFARKRRIVFPSRRSIVVPTSPPPPTEIFLSSPFFSLVSLLSYLSLSLSLSSRSLISFPWPVTVAFVVTPRSDRPRTNVLIGAGLGWGTAPRVITGVSLWIHKVAGMEVDNIAARIPRFWWCIDVRAEAD